MSKPRDHLQLPVAPWPRMLHVRPMRNKAVEVKELADHRVQVRVYRRRPWFLLPPLSWVLPTRPSSSFELDPLGADIWRLSNGERTLEQIVDACAAQCELTFHESRVAVQSYVQKLVTSGILVLVAPKGEPAA